MSPQSRCRLKYKSRLPDARLPSHKDGRTDHQTSSQYFVPRFNVSYHSLLRLDILHCDFQLRLSGQYPGNRHSRGRSRRDLHFGNILNKGAPSPALGALSEFRDTDISTLAAPVLYLGLRHHALLCRDKNVSPVTPFSSAEGTG